MLEYLNKFEQADRIRRKIYGNPAEKDPGILQKIKSAKQKDYGRHSQDGGSYALRWTSAS
jgi:hypothetical protein